MKSNHKFILIILQLYFNFTVSVIDKHSTLSKLNPKYWTDVPPECYDIDWDTTYFVYGNASLYLSNTPFITYRCMLWRYHVEK